MSLVLLLCLGGSFGWAEDAEHDHDHEAVVENKDAGHENDAHGEESAEIELTPEAMRMAGVELLAAGPGVVSKELILSGEVGFDEDRLVHITPRFAGIVLSVGPRLGDFVNQGEVVAVVESNESLTAYEIKAPMTGRVIRRHISVGEFVSEEHSVFVIADLSQVWVNLAVYPKDADWIEPGLPATIKTVGADLQANGIIDYVTPVLDIQTRSITARVILPNRDGNWRPGAFVQATVAAGASAEGLVVEREAVQLLDGETVVFVEDEPRRFRPVQVLTGESDSRHVLILGGLEAGQRYVAHGAFDLKAMIVTGSMDPHAGHGH